MQWGNNYNGLRLSTLTIDIVSKICQHYITVAKQNATLMPCVNLYVLLAPYKFWP